MDLTWPRRWLPDFLTPAARPGVEMGGQLDQIAATPPDVVVEDLLATMPSGPLRPFGRALLADPTELLPQLVEAMRVWYDEAIAPDWPRCERCLTPTSRTGRPSSPRAGRGICSSGSTPACGGSVTGWSATTRSSGTSTCGGEDWR